MKNKKMIFPLIVFALAMMMAGGYLVLGKQASAADATPASSGSSAAQNPSSLADRLAQKLNLNKDQVSTALDQIKQENKANCQANFSANLDKAVKDGVITSDQKQKILDHQAQMQQKRKQQRADNKKWASDNGIDFSKLAPYIGGKGHRGYGKANK